MSRQAGVKKRRLYTQDNLCDAVQAVRGGGMSVQAASAYSVPRSTISDKVSGKTSLDKCSPGPNTILSTGEENHLAAWAIEMSRIGYGRTKQELLDTVQKIMTADGRDNPFTNNRPGKDWYVSFMKRHPILSQRQQQQLGKERAWITPKNVENWFMDLKTYIDDEVKDTTLWNDATRWYNADESGFPLNPKCGKVLAMKGTPNVYQFTSSDKSQITVLACMSASGHYTKPFIVYAGQRFGYNPLEGFDEAIMGRSENGWMDTELFMAWLTDVFVKDINEQKVSKPVVLLVDGHSTHVTMEASDICRQNGIILYCLLQHASHIMQPCDVRLFAPLKEHWKQAVRQYSYDNIGETVTKQTFAKVFKGAWVKSATVGNAVKGFRDSGLFPFSPAKVMGTLKMEPSRIFSSVAASTSVSPPTNDNTIHSTGFISDQHIVSQSQDAGKHVHSLVTPRANLLPSSPTVALQAGISQSPTRKSIIPSSDSISTTSNPSTLSIGAGCVTTPIIPTTPEELPSHPSTDSSKASLSTVSAITSDNGAQANIPLRPTSQTTAFDSVLRVPKVTHVKKNVNVNRIILPKAITSDRFRQLMEEKKMAKRMVEEVKEQRKKEREEKRKEKEQEKLKKLKIKNEKLRLKDLRHEKKKNSVEKLLVDDDSDDARDVDSNACYSCENNIEKDASDWIRCTKCARKFHVACTPTEDLIDNYFECKYC